MSPKRPSVTVCRITGCAELRPCPVGGHEPEPWAGSTRHATLPAGWSSRIVPRILRRDPICSICHAAPSAEVDHIDDPDDHDDANLQGLCTRCHREKTQRQAAAARRHARG